MVVAIRGTEPSRRRRPATPQGHSLGCLHAAPGDSFLSAPRNFLFSAGRRVRNGARAQDIGRLGLYDDLDRSRARAVAIPLPLQGVIRGDSAAFPPDHEHRVTGQERRQTNEVNWWPQRDTHPFVLWNFAELYAPPSPSRALHLSQLLPSPVIGRRFRSRAPPQSPKSNDLPFEIDQMGMTREKGNWTRFFHDLKGRAMFKASVELSGAPAS